MANPGAGLIHPGYCIPVLSYFKSISWPIVCCIRLCVGLSMSLGSGTRFRSATVPVSGFNLLNGPPKPKSNVKAPSASLEYV